MSVLFTRRGKPPSSGKLLSDYVEGDVVLINENGSPVEFYVAKHNYEPTLNGSGRTLLVRKDCQDKGDWDSEPINAYVSSTVDVWLTNTYIPRLDSNVREAIKTTTFPYTPGDFSYGLSTLSRDVFILSMTELGLSASYGNVEGSALPIASTLQALYVNGTLSAQWTRTPYENGDTMVYGIKGTATGNYLAYENLYYRPCFTLSGNTIFSERTNKLRKVV